MKIIKGKGQRLIPEELLKYLQEVKNTYPEALKIVSANPTLSGDEATLEGAEINGIKYKVGGGGGKLYHHHVFLYESTTKHLTINIISTSSIAYTYSTLHTYIRTITNNSENAEIGYACLSRNGTYYGYSCCASSVGLFYSKNNDGTNSFAINTTATVTDTITEV